MFVELSREIEGYLYEVFVTKLTWWQILGFVAQIMFTARFVVQWLASERAGRSVIPFSFWTLSIGGGLLLFMYALVQRDPVYILGQGASVLIYLRNVSFVLKERRQHRAGGPA